MALFSVMLPVLAFSLAGATESTLRLVYIILGFSLIIFLHELGHFLVARACSVKCLAFSIGIGPRMLGWRKGGKVTFGNDPYDPEVVAKGKTLSDSKTLGEREDDKYALKDPDKGVVVQTEKGPVLIQPDAKNLTADILAKKGDTTEQKLEHFEAATTHSDLPQTAAAPAHSQSVGDCDYRVSWLPLGGYVRMLGQDDMDPTKVSTDPHAFNQRPIWQRMCIVSAGVIMNIIFAAVVFSIIFSPGIGVDFPPAVIGTASYNSPAARQGLQMGDRVVAIDDARPHGFVEFTDLQIAAALSTGTRPIKLTIERTHEDGTKETLDKFVTPEGPHGANKGFLAFGVSQMPSLNIARSQAQIDQTVELRKDEPPEVVATLKSLKPRDQIVEANGIGLKDYRQFYGMVQENGPKPMKLTLKNTSGPAPVTREVTLAPQLAPVPELGASSIAIFGMGPQLKIEKVISGNPGERAGLKDGDIIVRMGDRTNPSADEAVSIVRSVPNQPLEIVVDRDGSQQTIKVTPKSARGEGVIGVAFDTAGEGTPRVALRDLQSPAADSEMFKSGEWAEITKADGEPVKSWMKAVEAVRTKKAGEKVEFTYKANGKGEERTASFTVDAGTLASLGERTKYWMNIPVEYETRNQHGANAWEAVLMGGEHTVKFVQQVYLTLRGLFIGTVDASNLHGIVGITKIGYEVQERGPVWLWYVLAMVSVNLAVANFLPLPIVDGGLFLLLILEKIRGKPLPLKVQSAIQVVGIVLLAGLFLFVTWNDIGMFGKQ
jgi:regulator of sigma E protease